MQQPSDTLDYDAYAAPNPPEHASRPETNSAAPAPPFLHDSLSPHSSAASVEPRYASYSAYSATRPSEADYTPPSSFSPLPSSQPFVPRAPAHHVTVQHPGSSIASSYWRSNQIESRASSPASDSGNSGSPTHGSKRTASGSLKMPAPAPSGQPPKTRFGGTHHSRNTSIASNASSVGELSAQLKTRLTYAMAKVQYGWDSHSTAERDTVTSPGSPPAPIMVAHSPQASLASANRRSRDLAYAVTRPLSYGGVRPGTSYSSASAQSRPSTAISDQYDPHRRPNGVPSLAPAAELKSHAHDRRLNARHAPPMLSRAAGPPPHLSTPRAAPATPTHTQQEQDAVDTLVFMSSPANSAHFPHHRHSHSTSTASALSPRRDAHASAHHAAKRRSLGMTFRSETDVDRLLDQMAEDPARSSDEEDVELAAHGPTSATSTASTARRFYHPNGMPVDVGV